MPSNPNELAANFTLQEPTLLFAGRRTHKHPLRGLSEHGPYSADLGFPTQVRLAYLAPADLMARTASIGDELTRRHEPIEALIYYITYEGFNQVFRSTLVPAPGSLQIQTPRECDGLAAAGNGNALVDAILG